MSRKLIITLMLSIGLSTSALAQTTGSIERTPSRATESGEVALDPGIVAHRLTTGAEIRAHWQSLSPKRQAQLISDCASRISGGSEGNQKLNQAAPLGGTSPLCAWVNTL